MTLLLALLLKNMHTNQVIHGDCLEEIKNIPDGSIDCIITDPPYGIDYQSAWRTDKTKWKPKIANDKMPYIWWIYQAVKKLKSGGCLICFCRFDVWNDFSRACELAGLEVKAELVWDKMNHGTGDLKGTPGFRHEIAVFATKGRFIFHGKRPQSLFTTPRINPIALTHPNEKPVQLMEWLVEHYCPSEGIVLDAFAGTGAVGVACKNLNRNYILIEKEKEYIDIINKRLQ